jgi:hypothetical protein
MPQRSQRHKQEIQGSSRFAFFGPWVAGVDTVTPVVVTGGNARCERLGTTNPRIYKQVSGLMVGASYRVDSVHTVGTATLIGYCRVSASTALTNDVAEVQRTTTGPYSINFVAPASVVYIGVALGATVNGNYCLTQDAFTVTRTS